MTDAAAANPASAGSDSVQPALTLDDAANLDVYDPGEDNVDDEQEQQSASATDEAETSQEAETTDTADDDDETTAKSEGTADTADKPEPADDVTVTVNGEALPLSALKSGYMRQADYSRKTQEVANSRRDLEALSARVTSSVNAIAEFLAQQLPAQPDFALSQTDPMAFMRQKALYDAATERLNAILAKAGEVKEVANTLTATQRKELLEAENAKLAEAFPTTATQEGRKKFFDAAASAARELGYTDEEIQTVSDHRMFALAHYARIGMQAEQAKAKAVKKVENVPPVAPQKRQPGANAGKVQRNKEAMKRLARTGSIADAMAIDFD